MIDTERYPQSEIDPLADWRRWTRATLLFMLGTAAFAVAYTQWPPLLRESTHQVFAGSGCRGLRQPPAPTGWPTRSIRCRLFRSWLKRPTRWLDPTFFYLFHALLLGIYLFSLIGIMNRTVGLNRTSAGAALLSP